MQSAQPENKTGIRMDGVEKCGLPEGSQLTSILADMLRSALAWEKTNGKPGQAAGANVPKGLTYKGDGHTLDSHETVAGGEPNDDRNQD
jgi:hypothetical protein